MGLVPVSFSTTSAVVAKVRADLASQGFTGAIKVGKHFVGQYRDPTSGGTIVGSVVIVPLGRSGFAAPRLNGGNPRPTFTLARALDIYCWSTAPLGGFDSQYEADLTAAEVLTAAVLRSFELFVPGAKRGGTSDVVDAGENSFGVEVVTSLTIDLEQPDTTYQLVTGAVFKPNYAMEFPDGNGGSTLDTGSDA